MVIWFPGFLPVRTVGRRNLRQRLIATPLHLIQPLDTHCRRFKLVCCLRANAGDENLLPEPAQHRIGDPLTLPLRRLDRQSRRIG